MEALITRKRLIVVVVAVVVGLAILSLVLPFVGGGHHISPIP